MQSLSLTRVCGGSAISPNGKSVAWVCGGAIWVKNLAGGSHEPHEIARGYRPAWSPDSARIVFLSSVGTEGQAQIRVISATGGAGRRLTDLTGSLADPQWSPDGKTLAFLFIKNAPRPPGPTMPMTPRVGLIRERVFEQRLALVDVISGRVRILSPPDFYVYEYDWAPNGKEVVATAARGAGDNNWYVAQLCVIDVNSGRTQTILKPDMQIGGPRWSPSGRQIAFIGGLMSDEGTNGGDIYVIAPGNGPPRDITPRMRASARELHWFSSDRVLFTEYVDGESGIAEVDATDGKIKTLWTGAEFSPEGGWLGSFSLANDGSTSAAELQSFDRPPEVWVGPLGKWTQVTNVNEGLQPTWGKVADLHWKSGPWSIQGWLFYPLHYDPHRRYPMVVDVHGGPAWINPPAWPSLSYTNASAFSTDGYFVLLPNPRGSQGGGEAFTRANVRDIGHGDLRDILVGINKVVTSFPVDKDRIGITGWSYGGYMTMWAVTQTHLFRAAVAGPGISDWLSYYGEADIPQWVIPYFGASVYDDPAIYARRSPMDYIKNVRTPTLLLVGSADGECPAPQSLEFWHALRRLRVKTELVIYPGEGHSLRKPQDIRNAFRRKLEWFNEYLK
ncbi:MAG: prolyl oligopeptidase family serine peptidase [Terriglobia bacterium]